MREGVNKVALRLFEHNEKAYKSAIRMIEQYGKAAIVHPTGIGKSYIASEITLGESVVRGILPAPKYVTTVYQYQKALAKYQALVDNLWHLSRRRKPKPLRQKRVKTRDL